MLCRGPADGARAPASRAAQCDEPMMPQPSDSVPPLTPDQVAAILAPGPGCGEARPQSGTPLSWTPARAGDPEFEARSRRDTALANELLRALREARAVVEGAPLAADEAAQAAAAMDRFERALFELLRFHGT
jgi:hypothetical protein